MYKLDMPVTRQCSDKGEWYWGAILHTSWSETLRDRRSTCWYSTGVYRKYSQNNSLELSSFLSPPT